MEPTFDFSIVIWSPLIRFYKKPPRNIIPPSLSDKYCFGGNGPHFPKGGWFDRFMIWLINTSRHFLPTRRENREAFTGDLLEIYNEMREDGLSKATIFFAVSTQIISFFSKALNGNEVNHFDKDENVKEKSNVNNDD